MTTGFGQNPPAFGVNVLAGPDQGLDSPLPLASLMPYYNGFGNYPPATQDPATALEHFLFMTGKWRDGLPLTEGGLGYTGQESVDFAFPGLPTAQNTWTEYSAGNQPGDRRALINYEPFDDFSIGGIKTFHTSFTFSDNQTNHLDQVAGLQSRMDSIQDFFSNCYDLNSTGFPPCSIIATNVKEPAPQSNNLKIYPNPTSGFLTIESEVSVEHLQVLDLQGKVVFEGRQVERLDLSHLPKGLYVLRVETAQQLIHKKILHQ